MQNWDEIRTAYQVARLGTVSGAAEALGVHHATVIRHVDALESRLGVKLFQRHARGYTPTEAGADLLRVAQTTDDQFQQLSSRIRGRGAEVSGELLVTSLVSYAELIVPALAAFRSAHPALRLRYLTDDRVYRLEYGEAHIALRAGPAPQEPDNVVQKFQEDRIALYGTEAYVEARGRPGGEDRAAFAGHSFVGPDSAESRAPFDRWLRDRVDDEQMAFRSNDTRVQEQAIRAGLGLGFLRTRDALRAPGLVEILPPHPEWATPLWLVTHVDLHRTAKVQAFLAHLKKWAAEAPDC